MYRRNIKLGLTMGLAMLISFHSIAQNNTDIKFTLEEVIAYSIEKNTSILNAHLDILASKKKVWETTAIGLPQANVKVAYQNVFTVPVMNFPITTLNSTPNSVYPEVNDYELTNQNNEVQLGVEENITTDFTVTQLIFNGSYIVGLQASRTYKLLSEQGLEKTESEIKELVTNSFYLCLVLEESFKNLESTVSNQRNTQKEIRALFEAGFVEEADADQIDLSLNSLELSLSSLQRDIDLAYLLLKLQIGYPIDDDMELLGDLKTIIRSLDINSSNEMLFTPENNIDYKLLLTQERLSNLNMKNIKAEFLPSVAFFYNHQELSNSPDFNFSSPDIIGVNLEMPIFSSGQRLAKVSQATIELQKVSNSRNEAYSALKLNYIKLKSNFMTAQEKIILEEKNMVLSKRIYDKTLIKYQNGMVGSMELTQAQNQYLNSQGNYFNAVYDLLSSKTSLDKLLGKI